MLRRSTGCVVGQENDAQQVLDEALADIREANPPTRIVGELTLRQLAERWIEGRTDKVSSVDEAGLLRSHVFGEIGDVPLSELTHPSPVQAFDYYTRIKTVWPERCRVVLAIRHPSTNYLGGVTDHVTAACTRKDNARTIVPLRDSDLEEILAADPCCGPAI